MRLLYVCRWWRKKTHHPYNYFITSTWIQDNQLYFNCIHPFQEFAVEIIRFFQLGKSSRFSKTMKCTSLWWSRWLNFLQVCGGHGLGDEWRRSSRAFVGHGLYDLGAIGCLAGVRSLGSRSDFSSLLMTSYIMQKPNTKQSCWSFGWSIYMIHYYYLGSKFDLCTSGF